MWHWGHLSNRLRFVLGSSAAQLSRYWALYCPQHSSARWLLPENSQSERPLPWSKRWSWRWSVSVHYGTGFLTPMISHVMRHKALDDTLVLRIYTMNVHRGMYTKCKMCPMNIDENRSSNCNNPTIIQSKNENDSDSVDPSYNWHSVFYYDFCTALWRIDN